MKQMLYKIDCKEELENALLDIRSKAGAAGTGAVLLHYYCGCPEKVSEQSRNELADQITDYTFRILPDAEMLGISSAGEICRAEITRSCVLLQAFLLEKSWVRIVFFSDVVANEKKTAEKLLEIISEAPDLKGVEILLSGRNIDSAPVFDRLKECRGQLPFFGGYACEYAGSGNGGFLMNKEGLLYDSMAVILYGGSELHIDAGRTTGWKPLGRTFKVTAAEGRRLYSVNGIPAYELYDRFMKVPGKEYFRDYAMEFPLMLRKGKMQLLRHPLEQYDDLSILLDGNVTEGNDICLSYGAPMEIIRKINMRSDRIREFEPEAILIFSCLGRKNFWGDLMGMEIEPFQKIAESGGSCLSGQIMRNFQTGRILEHRLTLLSVAMREGEKTGRFVPETRMDEEVLKGRMFLVHRMSTLIESMVGELQKNNDTLLKMNERLARANAELNRVAVTDELTGLYNRREIERRIKESLEKAKEGHSGISLIMLDIDFFKKVNDTYGHDAGDRALREVSGILREYTDEACGEAAGRWGGEEFFVLVPDKKIEEALLLAEKIRKAVESRPFPGIGHLTVSLGVTDADAQTNYQAIFINVDRALYRAKNSGRKRVIRESGTEAK